MKKVICVVCLLLLSISSTVFAQEKSQDAKPADNYGVYLGLVGGISIPIESTNAVWTRPSGTQMDFETKMKYGFLYGFKAGWLTPFTNRIMAVELEYNHLENKYDSANIEGLVGDMGGKISLNLLMLNLLARKPTGKFHPYVGFGLGYADVTVDSLGINVGYFPLTYSDGSSGVLAYQAMLGVDFDVYKNVSVGIGYKYIATAQKVSYESTYLTVDPQQRGNMDVEYRSHNLVLNVAYMF